MKLGFEVLRDVDLFHCLGRHFNNVDFVVGLKLIFRVEAGCLSSMAPSQPYFPPYL